MSTVTEKTAAGIFATAIGACTLAIATAITALVREVLR